ncbi:MAG: hypothetical protein ABIG08_00065, partial [bacterium]
FCKSFAFGERTKNGLVLGEEIFYPRAEGFPARPAERGGHWLFSDISDKMSSSRIVYILTIDISSKMS